VLEKVEGHALPGEQIGGQTRERGDLGPRRERRPIAQARLDRRPRPTDAGKDLRHEGQPGKDAGLLGDDARARPRVGRHRELRGEVAPAYILCDGCSDQRIDGGKVQSGHPWKVKLEGGGWGLGTGGGRCA